MQSIASGDNGKSKVTTKPEYIDARIFKPPYMAVEMSKKCTQNEQHANFDYFSSNTAPIYG